MSWSVSFPKPVPKAQALEALNALKLDEAYAKACPEAADQLESAKWAAQTLLLNIPGPYIKIHLSGHANGVGWKKKDNFANDTVNFSVTQICEEDMKYYEPKPETAATS